MLKKLVFLSILLLPGLAQAATANPPQARIFDSAGNLQSQFAVFDAGYSGGAELAVGAAGQNGAVEALFCPGPGHAAALRAYRSDGTAAGEFTAYAPNFNGGCYIASADVDGDGRPDQIFGAGYGGGPQVRIFHGSEEIRSYFAFSDTARQGVRVAAADLGNDGKSEVIAFSNLNSPAEYAIFGNDGHRIADYKLKEFNENGLSLAIGDFNGDGQKEFAIAGGYGNKPVIEIFGPGNKLLRTIVYGKEGYAGGLNLSAGDMDGDKKDDIIVSESFGGSANVSIYRFDGTKLRSFSAYSGEANFGVKTAAGDFNGDGKPDIIAIPENVGETLAKTDYKFIAVSLARQTLYRYQGGRLLGSYLVSTGVAKMPTPPGDYKIYRKRPLVRMTWYYGENNPNNYDLPNVPWVASFSGPLTIHGTYWHHNFGHPMSHGCVNMYTPDAKTVYDWVDIGTPIVIY